MTSALDRTALAAIAREVLDAASVRFVAGLGAGRAVAKGSRDFATELDLELERTIGAALRERTGIEVHGEEYGGVDVHAEAAWVLDPIDGTMNYSAGLPTDGILLALLDHGVPVLGLTWLPLVGHRFWALSDGPLHDGDRELPPLGTGVLADKLLGIGPVVVSPREHLPGPLRMRWFEVLSRRALRVRSHGSTGFDLAAVAAGILGGAVVFGHNAWDNAAGVALVRAAGGVVTDLHGEPWTIDSDSVLAAAPGVHEEIREVLSAVRAERSEPEWRRA